MAKAKDVDYDGIILNIFRTHYEPGATECHFVKREINAAADAIGTSHPGNDSDVLYHFRFRYGLPAEIRATEFDERQWIIEIIGKGRYRFRLAKVNRIVPRENLLAIKIPDATPEILVKHALDDEQALLARVRYNRLIDIFLGVTAYSLQNHLRTTLANTAQIEVDEVYVAVNRHGAQFIIPVQAKGGKDEIGSVQIVQDTTFAREKYPDLICRAIAVQFMARDAIAMFEVIIDDDEAKVVHEQHYRLVPSSEISPDDLRIYRDQL